LGRGFSTFDFERAFQGFSQLYHVRPHVVRASPDVLERYCALFAGAGDEARREVRHGGVPIVAAVLPPGMIAFEGEVDEDRMGDW
jgi:hypothetical protein